MEIQKFFLSDFICDMKNTKQGGEACVFKGLHSRHGVVAIKKWSYVWDEVNKEAELLMQTAYHQNIIQFLGILVDEQSKCIGYVMPYMPMGSLYDVIHSKSHQYDHIQVKSWVTKICYGLSYLHEKRIIHRDVKPSNILLGRCADDVKLSDFGMAKSLQNITHTLTKGLGTPLYMAPEILKMEEYDMSADVYSLSITIWEILHRRKPYDHIANKFDLSNMIASGERPKLNNNLPIEVSNLLTRCWHADASKRPTIRDVLELSKNIEFPYISFINPVNPLPTPTGPNNDGSIPKPNDDVPISKPIEQSSEKQTILLLGGWKSVKGTSSTLLMLKNNGQSWKQLNIKLPYAVYNHGAQFLNNNLYIFGGKNANNSELNWTYKLSKLFQWKKMADMNEHRSGISNSSVILNNKIWVCGGQDSYKNYLKTVESYDPKTNTWEHMKEMNECRSDAAATVVNGKIFCAGGFHSPYASNSVEFYDPTSGRWTIITTTMPQRIFGHSAVEISGHFIVIGGRNGEKDFNNVFTLDTTDKNAVWINRPPMSTSREYFSIAMLDGKIFVCGGGNREYYGYDMISSVEIFDGEVWSSGPKMPTPRRQAPAVVIPVKFARDLRKYWKCPIL